MGTIKELREYIGTAESDDDKQDHVRIQASQGDCCLEQVEPGARSGLLGVNHYVHVYSSLVQLSSLLPRVTLFWYYERGGQVHNFWRFDRIKDPFYLVDVLYCYKIYSLRKYSYCINSDAMQEMYHKCSDNKEKPRGRRIRMRMCFCPPFHHRITITKENSSRQNPLDNTRDYMDQDIIIVFYFGRFW